MFRSPAKIIHCWLYKVLLCMFVMLNPVFGINITAQYPQDGTGSFQFSNLAIDVGTGKLYAGALNHLIQLDENLTSLMDITTGPVPDDPTCYYSIGQDPCYDLNANPINVRPTDNYNKVLLVDSRHQQLVVCGNVYQGSCETRDLQNLTAVSRYVGTLVASNSPSYSTVAFTGPGPDGDDVLYVGNFIPGISNAAWNQYNIDGVCSRNLTGNKFQLLYKYTSTFTYGTFAFLSSTASVVYNVTFVAGFSIQGFSYFLTQQPASYTLGSPPSVSSQIISKIVQVCQNDKNYDSYVEMQIQCKSNGVDYNLVQAATFVHPGSNLASALNISTDDYVLIGVFATTSSSQASSALCIFKLRDIRDKFTQNINACYRNGSLQVGPQLYESSRSCQPNSAVVDVSFCGSNPFYTTYRNSPLVGVIPLISSLPSLILNNPPVNVTAMAATNEENHTVLFMGTSNGGMIKVLLDSINGSVYDNTQMTSSSNPLPINPDLLLSPNKTHLYAMTSNTIYKIPTSECDKYDSCSSCLTSRDPYCGWCTLLNSCRRRSLCPNASMPIYWITPYSLNTMACPNISNIDPSSADVNSNVTVKISVSQLPTLPSPAFYSCVFGSDSFTSKADVTNNQLVCQLPQMRPTVSSTIGSLLVNLTLQSSSYGVKFLQTSFTFYNCSSNSNCKSCTSSSWKCVWCVASSLCLDQRNSSFCDVSSNRLLNDSNTCPRITTSANNLVVSGASTVIELTALNLPNSDLFFCGLSTSSKTFPLIPANKSGDNSKLFCNSYQYSSLPYGNQSWNITALWGPNKYLLDGIYIITVYDCSTMSGGDCSKCKSFATGPSSKYNCSWCDNGCQAPQNCHAQVSVCPKASITLIGPLVGPVEGGTRLTITGTNIGTSDNQVQIYIGTKLCTSANNYTVSTRYVCIVPPVVSLISCQSCPINITITNGVMQNGFMFSYMNISLDSILPFSGPISGGTHVTIHGNDLSIDEGTVVSVNFADQSCDIIRSECNRTQLVFLSPSVANSATINKITVTIDGTTRQLGTTYTYVSNPAITSVTPVSAYKSGGCVITATGQHLDASQSARVDFTSGNDTLKTAMPDQRNESSLQFRSPSFPSDSVTVLMTFTLDGFQYNSNFSIIPDPVIAPFDDNKLVSTSSVLTIKKVRGLLGRSFCTDVQIKIGNQNCPLLSGYDGTTDQLLCTLSNVTGGSYSVNVTVGWLNFYLGELVVPSASSPSSSTANSTDIIWQIIVGVIGGILIIIIIIIIIFARKYSASKRECEDLMKAIDDLERNYRNDCRQAFTELQTDISDFDSDIRDVGIPFLDYRMYSYMLLYPMKNIETILHVNKKSPVVGYDQKMHKFNQLLNYKHFLLTFIRTLENQTKDFSIKDKARVASLLSLILLDKLDYATEIIKILLEELIQKSMNQNPKIMLRRAESVVEKLLANWLSLSMYDYLTTHAGAPLYMLYKAIKHQTEKGPIDACTAEAKYTMSEDRLLREKIEPKDLTINVLDDSYQKFTCKMLDCDTISQAKEKALDAIYRISPYSKRPTLHQVELKYLLITDSTLAKAGNDTVTLNDEDQTMEVVNGWKKINTLGHYHIPDDEGTLRRNYCGKLELGGGALNPIQLGEDVKLFHLVKHEEENAVDTKASKTIKVITEIFLPRLLSTKLTLEEYINNLFQSILQVNSSLPPTVKYLFDLLDSEACKHGISADQDIVHIWKSNSLPLRFWVNLIKNPEFLFDINKTPAIDCCLSVIAQTFMDSCSTQEFKLTKDSPSTKLLFAKDLPRYQEMVRNFYEGVQALPTISEKEMIGRMCTYSRKVTDFNMEFALRELYGYATKFKYEFAEALDNNPSTHKMNFAHKFDQLEIEVEEGQEN